MKKTINLFMALMLLLSCVLTACMGNETDMPSDEPATSSQSSKAEENSDPDVSNVVVANPEDITGTLWEGETKVYNDNRVIVYDNQANYDFFKNRRVRVYIPFVVKSVENGIATVEFLNAAKTKQDIKYSDVVYGEENISSGFTIKDESLGDIKVEDGFWLEGETFIELYKKDETVPLVNESDWVASGYIRFDCEYDYYADYKCIITYPNGKTAEKTVVLDDTENKISTIDIRRHHFQDTKASFTGGEVRIGVNDVNFFGIGEKYGTGYGKFSAGIKNIADGKIEISGYNGVEGNVLNYEEPVYDTVYDNGDKKGKIVINGVEYAIKYFAKEGVHDVEGYSIEYPNAENVIRTIDLYYTATEEEKGRVVSGRIYFTWTSDGNAITLTFPNGYTTTKNIYLNEYGNYVMEDCIG